MTGVSLLISLILGIQILNIQSQLCNGKLILDKFLFIHMFKFIINNYR